MKPLLPFRSCCATIILALIALGLAGCDPPPAKPAIVSGPASTTVAVGETATFNVVASGFPPPSAVWRKNGLLVNGLFGVSVSAGASFTLTLTNVQSGDAGGYDFVIMNSQGSVTSPRATLTVTPAIPPAITTQPVGATVDAGASATFVVVATGSGLTYQWKRNGADLFGATNSRFSLAAAHSADAGTYSVTVRSNGGNIESENAFLIVRPRPPVLPAQNVTAGANAIFYAVVAGTDSAQFSGLPAVAVDGGGNVFVADQFHGAIRKITPTGLVVTLSQSFTYPTSLAVAAKGDIFVADSLTYAIYKLTPSGAVTVFAGTPNKHGSADGPSDSAQFSGPSGLAVDTGGNLFVADPYNETIRKITPGGVVTVLAGSTDLSGHSDGASSEARFYFPSGVAVDDRGNVFVADTYNHTIRKIAADGIVTTLAGSPGQTGSTDGVGGTARFNFPLGVAVDRSGNVFVADEDNDTIRKITADGLVTTLAGSAGMSGNVDGTGSAARFSYPAGLALDDSGNVFVADSGNNTIRKISPSGVVTTIAGAAGGVDVTDRGLSYQWKKNGVAIAGATGVSYAIPAAAAADMGFYSVAVTGGGATVESAAAILTIESTGTSRLVNLSTRGLVPAGGELTVGFFIRRGGKSVLVRATGPALGSFGVAGALADPQLTLIPAGTNSALLTNDDWGGGVALADVFAKVGAFPLPATSKDAAVTGLLAPGGYSARITSAIDGGSGAALAEVYERDDAPSTGRFTNLSALGFVGAGAGALVPGFVIGGTAAKQLLIRVVGPGLAAFGVASAIADPQLGVVPAGQSFTVASNDNWDGSAVTASVFAQVGAFALAPGSKDAAVIVRLPPGGYTVAISGVGNTTGTALVEIYDLDP